MIWHKTSIYTKSSFIATKISFVSQYMNGTPFHAFTKTIFSACRSVVLLISLGTHMDAVGDILVGDWNFREETSWCICLPLFFALFYWSLSVLRVVSDWTITLLFARVSHGLSIYHTTKFSIGQKFLLFLIFLYLLFQCLNSFSVDVILVRIHSLRFLEFALQWLCVQLHLLLQLNYSIVTLMWFLI